jgi:hypothetical protein
MKVTLDWTEEDYKGHHSQTHKQDFTVRDFWLPFIRQMLLTFEAEEWIGKPEKDREEQP